METVNYKGGIDKEVYYVYTYNVPYMVQCGTCIGEGHLKNKIGKEIACPTCQGKKEMEMGGSIKHAYKKDKIKEIKIEIEDTIRIEYFFYKDRETYTRAHDNDVFETEEEAITRMEKLNKGIMGYTS